MKYRYTYLVVILWWFCLSCSEPTKPKDGESRVILGKWNWLESIGVESRLRLTPDSLGYTQIFRFDPDSSFYLYRDDTLTVSGRYRITFEGKTPFADTTMVLRVDKWTPFFGSQWAMFLYGVDSLTLEDLAFDAAEHRFVRIN